MVYLFIKMVFYISTQSSHEIIVILLFQLPECWCYKYELPNWFDMWFGSRALVGLSSLYKLHRSQACSDPFYLCPPHVGNRNICYFFFFSVMTFKMCQYKVTFMRHSLPFCSYQLICNSSVLVICFKLYSISNIYLIFL